MWPPDKTKLQGDRSSTAASAILLFSWCPRTMHTVSRALLTLLPSHVHSTLGATKGDDMVGNQPSFLGFHDNSFTRCLQALQLCTVGEFCSDSFLLPPLPLGYSPRCLVHLQSHPSSSHQPSSTGPWEDGFFSQCHSSTSQIQTSHSCSHSPTLWHKIVTVRSSESARRSTWLAWHVADPHNNPRALLGVSPEHRARSPGPDWVGLITPKWSS